jgi:hypothetical protein
MCGRSTWPLAILATLALLLLAAASCPDRIEAASVDHGLRRESRAEAEAVAAFCAAFSVPHEILVLEWDGPPDANIQARAREEREVIGHELARAVGLGGRDRPAGSAAERARVNTTRAIRGAIRRIEESDPSLGRHLDRAVRTGAFCAYDPSPQDEVTWTMNIVQPEGTPS